MTPSLRFHGALPIAAAQESRIKGFVSSHAALLLFGVGFATCLCVVGVRAHRYSSLASTQASPIACTLVEQLDCPQAHFLAARALPALHRLEPVDLRAPENLPLALAATLPAPEDLVGLYTLAPVEKGQPLALGTLAERPRIPAFFFPPVRWPLRDGSWVGHLNAGVRVALCAQTCTKPLTVVAVDCLTRSTEGCVALLEGTPGDVSELKDSPRSDLKWVTRPLSSLAEGESQ